MREHIKENLDKPGELEKLYRDNKSGFKKAFNELWNEIQHSAIARTWNERLNYRSEAISWGLKQELLVVVILSIFAGLIAKIPALTGISEDYFYPRHLGFVVFPALSAYFAWKQSLSLKKTLFLAAVFIVSAVYINLFPSTEKSDTLNLVTIHLPLMLWATTAYAFTADAPTRIEKRMSYLRYNGDLLVMSAVILLAGFLLSAVTVGLFKLIGLNIEAYYFQYVAIWGLAGTPVVATWLVQTNPQLVNHVSPVMAKVFTPLVLLMLTIYLLAIVYTGKDPYNDREFLLIFNALLIGVMAIIHFSLAEADQSAISNFSLMMLFLLSLLTIIINSIALSAIVFRISSWGVTPNRLAVMGANLLILINLVMVSYRLFLSLRQSEKIETVNNSIAVFLPLYAAWTAVVVFVFPILFNFA